MPRTRQEGNRYFSLDVDFFSDKKIKILKARYGADGITLYIYLLCEIYKSGYYLKVDEDFEFIISDDLNMDCNKVKQVLNFLLERSLFDNKLFQSDKVLTSAGIQRRFQRMVKSRAVKNPIKVEGFWILPEDETEPFIKVNPSLNNSEKKDNNSEKNEFNSENYDIKEKEKKRKYIYTASPDKYFEDEALDDAFRLFIRMRQNHGDILMGEQILAYRDELAALSQNTEERIAMAKQAFMNGWKNFYPPNKRAKKSKTVSSNRFNNFPQRDNADVIKQLEAMGGKSHDTESGNV